MKDQINSIGDAIHSSDSFVNKLTAELKGLSVEASLKWLHAHYPGKAVFSTSFGFEDQLITHYIFSNQLNIRVATLDTGRLFSETYLVWNRTIEKYQQKVDAFYPEPDAIEKLVNEKGPLSFYQSIENRKECCQVRKVYPLQRLLKGAEIWITGIRAEQSGSRNDLGNVEWDDKNQMVKVHPLFELTSEDVWQEIKKQNIPYNSLHDKGFPSIGCQPCTRAVQPGEDFRAGRWWWEKNTGKECGLHQ